MIDIAELRDCYMNTPSKMVLLVVDGLGGLAHPRHPLVRTGNGPHPQPRRHGPGERLRHDHAGASRRRARAAAPATWPCSATTR